MNTFATTTTCTFLPRGNRGGAKRQHRLPVCPSTGLARFRDRHQARASAAATRTTHETFTLFSCPDCKGVHLEQVRTALQAVTSTRDAAPDPIARRRYVLVDVENITRGAACSRSELAELWARLRDCELGLTDRDHVVIGAARGVARRFRPAISESFVKWVVGANAPDSADNALLAAIDLHRVARDFDELVIVSGDHAFAELARRARGLGLRIHVVTSPPEGRRSTLARELAETADVTSVLHAPIAAARVASAA